MRWDELKPVEGHEYIFWVETKRKWDPEVNDAVVFAFSHPHPLYGYHIAMSIAGSDFDIHPIGKLSHHRRGTTIKSCPRPIPSRQLAIELARVLVDVIPKNQVDPIFNHIKTAFATAVSKVAKNDIFIDIDGWRDTRVIDMLTREIRKPDISYTTPGGGLHIYFRDLGLDRQEVRKMVMDFIGGRAKSVYVGNSPFIHLPFNPGVRWLD